MVISWEQPWYQETQCLTRCLKAKDLEADKSYHTDRFTKEESERVEKNWKKFRKVLFVGRNIYPSVTKVEMHTMAPQTKGKMAGSKSLKKMHVCFAYYAICTVNTSVLTLTIHYYTATA